MQGGAPMKRGVTFMREDVKRYGVAKAVIDARMTNREGAAALHLSIRQLQRIKIKIKQRGLEGVLHGNRGRPSCRAFSGGFKEQLIDLVKKEYFDFNFW